MMYNGQTCTDYVKKWASSLSHGDSRKYNDPDL